MTKPRRRKRGRLSIENLESRLQLAGETILLVSDAADPDVGGGNHEDDELVDWLTGLGYNVDTSGMGGAMTENGLSVAEIDALQDADLVLVSRRTNSGNYDGDKLFWNQTLTTPLLLQSGYLDRQERWGWHDPNTPGNAAIAATDMTVASPNHPFLQGVNGNAIQVFDWNDGLTPGVQAPSTVYISQTSSLAPTATLVGAFDGRAFLYDLPEGTVLANGNGQLGGRRVFMGHWGYDNANADYRWDDYLTDDYQTILSNVIQDMVFSDPAATPTVQIGAASNLTAVSATISGQVADYGGEPPTVTVYYGDEDGGQDPAAWDGSVDLGARIGPFTAELQSLLADTTYYFTARAENSAGQSWASPSLSFDTQALSPPAIVASAAANVTSSSAQVGAEVTETGNDPPRVTLFYGKSDRGTDPDGWDFELDLGIQAGRVSATVLGLNSQTGYFFRFQALNAAGATWTPAGSFLTGASALDDVVMFNDHGAGPLTHANATTFADNGTPSGFLRDIVTGAPTPIRLTTAGVGINYAGASSFPTEGTDADDIFGGVIDFTAGTGTSLEIRASSGSSYRHAFEGLDETKTYDFAGTAIRGNNAYTNRWTLVTLVGADDYTPAHSSGGGVYASGLADNQVAIWVGANQNAGQGFVAQWTDIDAGDDGMFEVVQTQYTGQIPTTVQANGLADGDKGYGFSAIRLIERFSGFAVVAASPTAGQALTTAPTTATIDFNLPIDQSTLAAADLQIDGNSAVGVTLVDQDSVSFQLPALTPGTYTMTIADSQVRSTSATGSLANVQFASSFTVLDAPTVANLAAANLSGTTAEIGAQLVDSGGTTAELQLFWGDEDGGEVTSAWDHQINLGTFGGGARTQVLENLLPDTTYYFRALARNPVAAVWAAATSQFTTPVINAPQLANGSATNLGPFSADLGGQVVDDGAQAPAITIYYGETDGGADANAWAESISAGVQSGAFAVSVSNLTPATTYFYRVQGSNLGGDAWASASTSFTTQAVTPPAVRTDAATSVGAFSAVLGGEVLDIGNDAPAVTIFYGPGDGGTNANAWAFSVNLGLQSGAFTAPVTNLQAETTYFTRIRGTNYAGDGWAASSQSFVTSEVPTLRITEFMALNDTTAMTRTRASAADAFAGPPTSPDWIEIHNFTAESFNIGGFALTDDADEPTKWALPAGTSIQPNGYLVVWASALNITDPALDEAGRLHASFSLNDGGEYLAIAQPDGTIVHEFAPEYPRQVDDISYGIDVLDNVKYYRTPTPGAANNETSAFLGFVRDTRFSIDGGIFDADHDDPFTTVITTATPGATIVYTTDGSTPTLSPLRGTAVSAPDALTPPAASVFINTTVTLRAAAFADDLEPTNVDTQTYIFLEDVLEQPSDPQGFPTSWGGAPAADYAVDSEIVNNPAYSQRVREGLTSIPTLSVVGDVSGIFGPAGIYSNTTNTSLETPVSAELYNADGSKAFQINAGFKVQGGASRNPNSSPKHSLSLRFRETYGEGRLNYPLFADSPVDSFDSLQLRAMYNNSWIHWDNGQRARGTLIRDQWMRDSLLAMGEESAGRGDYVHLYINGLYWGVYNLHERQEGAHYAEYFGGQETDYDALNGGSPIDGNITAYNAMKATVASHDWEAIQQVLDVENYIDFTIIERYGSNNDLKANGNWRAAGGGPNNAPWRFYSWDGERVLEGVNEGAPGSTADPPGILNDLLTIEEFRVRFGDRLHLHFFNDGALTAEQTSARWEARMNQLSTAIVAESARWGDYRRDVHQSSNGPYLFYTPDDFWIPENNRLLDNYFPLRSDIVLNQYRGLNLYPNVAAPSVAQHGGHVPSNFPLTVNAPAGSIFYTTDGSDPRTSGAALQLNPGGQILLTASATLNARALNGGVWSALNSAFFIVGDGQLSVTEIHYNPHGPSAAELAINPAFDNDDFEFLELRNTGQGNADLLGVQFVLQDNEGIEFDFSGGNVRTLTPGDYVLVVKNQAAFEARYGTGFNSIIAGQYAGGLTNGGELLTLVDGAQSILQQFPYDDSSGWPQRADGGGSSLEIVDPAGDYLDPANWRDSVAYHGSPGSEGATAATSVVVNEVLSHTDPPQFDSIELHNTTGEAVDITGWWLSDSENNPAKYQIVEPTVIPPHAYVVFNERDHFNPNPYKPIPEAPGPNDFALSGKEGDQVYLMAGHIGDPVPSEFRDHVEFGAAFNGESWGRYPNAIGNLYPQSNLTLGAANSPPRVGPLVISEVMYDAPNPDGPDGIDPDKLEFLEIHNPTNQSQDLAGWALQGGIEYAFTAGTMVGPNSTLVVLPFNPANPDNAQSLTDFRTYYGIDAAVPLVGGYSGKLSNEGETVGLFRPDSPPLDEPDFTPLVLEDQVSYGNLTPWPDNANNNGNSIQRLDASLLGDDGANWVALTGTPGTALSGALQVISVSVNADIPDPPDLPNKAGQPSRWIQQRSELHDIVVSFSNLIAGDDQDVRLTNLGIDATAGVREDVDLSGQVTVAGNKLIIALSDLALQDGVFQLEILPSLTNSDGEALDGDGDGNPGGVFSYLGSQTNRFYRLKADFNGDAGVTIFDFPTFSYWFGAAVPVAPTYADLNGDGGVTIFDFPMFADNFGNGVTFPAGLSADLPVVVSQPGAVLPPMADPLPHAPPAAPLEERFLRERTADAAFAARRDKPQAPSLERDHSQAECAALEQILDDIGDDVFRGWSLGLAPSLKWGCRR